MCFSRLAVGTRRIPFQPIEKEKPCCAFVLATARQETIHPFAEGLSSDPEVRLDQVTSGAEALGAVRTASPHLVIIDSELPDTEPLSLGPGTAHGERHGQHGSGQLHFQTRSSTRRAKVLVFLLACRLLPGKSDAAELLRKLRQVLGLIA